MLWYNDKKHRNLIMKRNLLLPLSLSLLLLLTGCHTIATKTAMDPTPAPTENMEEAFAPAPTHTPAPTDTHLPTATPYDRPELALIGEQEMVVEADFTFTDPGCLAWGEGGEDLSDRVQVAGEVIPYIPDTYTLTYSVTDSKGDTGFARRTVIVKAVEMPPVEEPEGKVIYLTFDDGPCGGTEKLLDLLKQYDAKATFFVVGNKSRVDLIRRAYEEGHSIGVHTYTHVYEKMYASEEAYFEDFLATEQVIYEQTGEYTRLFRFPGGSGNTVSRVNKGIMSRLTQYMTNMGYRYFDWNVASGDCGEGATRETVTSAVIGGIQRKEYPIVLQHDIKPFSVSAVETILIWGRDNGYTFLPLTLTSPNYQAKVLN